VAVQLSLAVAGDHLDGTLEVVDPRIGELLPEDKRRSTLVLYPVTDEQWVAELAAQPGEWIPAVFSESDGRGYLHLGGRAMMAAG
jgi:hypothetical protein